MSLVERFETFMTRKTYNKSFKSCDSQIKNISNTMLCFNKLNQSVYDEIWLKKIFYSKDLRKRITTRETFRSRKSTQKPKVKNILEPEQSIQTSLQNPYNSLYCSKAIVYHNQKDQQNLWKKTLKRINQEQKTKRSIQNVKRSLCKSKCRINQQIHNNTIVHSVKPLFKSHNKKLKQHITHSLTISPQKQQKQYKPQNQTNRSSFPRKLYLDKLLIKQIEYPQKQKQFRVEKIDAWNSNIIPTQQFIF